MKWWTEEGPQRPPLSDKLVDWHAFALVGGEDFIRHRSILEVGPAYGLDTLWFAHEAGRWTVVDNASDVLEWISRLSHFTPSLDIIKADCRKLPFPDDHFHLVLDYSSFDNCGNPLAAYAEATRVLCHHGLLVSTYANYVVLGPSPDPTLEMRMHPNQLHAFLTEHGMWVRNRENETQARAVIIAQKHGEPRRWCSWWKNSVCTCADKPAWETDQ